LANVLGQKSLEKFSPKETTKQNKTKEGRFAKKKL
jgi:hypothetical protein